MAFASRNPERGSGAFRGACRVSRIVVSSLVTLLVAYACSSGAESPFADIEPGVKVTLTHIGGVTSDAVLARSLALNSAVMFIAAGDDWERPWHTVPAGDLTLMLSIDADTLGFIRFGTDFLVASRMGRESLLRQLSAAESEDFRRFLNTAAGSTPR